MNTEQLRIEELKSNLALSQDDLSIRTAELERVESERDALQARVTSQKCLLDQRWEMMRELEEVCGTKDVSKAVEYVKGLKARVKRLEEAGDALDNSVACGCGIDGPCRLCVKSLDGWKQANESKL